MLDFITVKNNDSASMEPGVTIKTIVVIKQMKVFVAVVSVTYIYIRKLKLSC